MIGQWLGIVGGSVGVVVFLGAVVVYLRGSYDTGTITTLSRSNTALDARVVLLEKENAALQVRVSVLEKENARLASLRPSAEAIAALDEFLRQHDVTAQEILRIVRQRNEPSPARTRR